MLDIFGFGVDIADDDGTLKVSTTKEIDMNENYFELNGIRYASEQSGGECIGCAFLGRDNEDCEADFDNVPPCHHVDRVDESDVIFVEKQQ